MMVLIGVLTGAILGGITGHFGRCQSGACPLTSRWWSGALYGAFLGFMFASMMATPAGVAG